MEKIIMPMLGETMNEGIIAKWRKKEGDKIEKGEILLEVTTDKATLEVESIASGILKKIVASEGVTIPVLQTIAWIGNIDETIPEETATEKIIIEKVHVTGKTEVEKQKIEQKEPARIFATPAAKRVAKELGITLENVKGTGPGGRITEEDVKKTTPITGTIPLTPMRKVIAERMLKSKREAPHYYVKMSVNMAEVMKLRNKLKEEYTKIHNVKLTYDDIILKAVSIALSEFSIVNATFTGTGIKYNEKINIGMAVALNDGLIVPVIKSVNEKKLIEIAKEKDSLVKKARENKLTPNDYASGTFTISNLGMFDVEDFIAVINPPESAILAIAKIEDKPVVVAGGIYVRPMLNITLSADHRIVDGALAAKFLQRIKQILELPEKLIV